MASMVVMAWPTAAPTGITQARLGMPSRCTVQAPQSATPQPNLVPFMPSRSRKTHSRGMSGDASTVCDLPLILSVTMAMPPGGSAPTSMSLPSPRPGRRRLASCSLLHLHWRTDVRGRAGSDDEVPPRRWAAGLDDLADWPDGVHDGSPCRVGHETSERLQLGRPLRVGRERKHIWLSRFEAGDGRL